MQSTRVFAKVYNGEMVPNNATNTSLFIGIRCIEFMRFSVVIMLKCDNYTL